MECVEEQGKSLSNMLSFFSIIGQIKGQKRTGWVNNNVQNVESVSDHMYRMAIMSMMLNSNEVDISRCIKMSLVHDMAECIVGDITPYCGVSKAEKDKKERDAMVEITTLLHNKQVADDIMDLWEEYNKQESCEAKAVKDIDRFEMILQAYEYEKTENREGELQSFFDGTKGKFTNNQVKTWVETLHKKRGSDG